MKKIITLLIALIVNALVLDGQQTVRVFNVKLNSKYINLQNSFFNPNYPSTSVIMEPGQLSETTDYWIGKIYTKNNLRENKTFLDLSNEETYYPLLDSIDMDYYSSFSLKNVLDKQFGDDAKYLAFRKAFKDGKNCEIKKKMLTDNVDNGIYFTALIKSKLDNVNPSTFTNSKEIEKEIKLGFKASLDTILLTKNLSGSSKLKADLHNLIENNITVSGKYYLVGYRKEYLSKVISYFTDKYEPNISKIKALPNKDQFTSTLIKYYDATNTGIFVGSALLSLEVNYDITKISKSGIEALIKANVQIPAIEIAKASAEILASFSLDKSYTGSAKTEQIFSVSYAYDLELEEFGKH